MHYSFICKCTEFGFSEDGEVVVLSDDSDISSLKEADLTFIRANYEKVYYDC